jgi:hypothetical protein
MSFVKIKFLLTRYTMADYNDGSRFGGDVISPYDDIGLSFEQVQLPTNRPMLLSRNEMPRLPVELPAQMDEISQKSLTRRIEGFTGMSRWGWSNEDHQLLLMFLLIVVIVMQVRLMWYQETPRHYDGGAAQVHYFMAPPTPLSPLTFGPQQ